TLIPSGWPTSGWITQGPGGSFSHTYLNAIDIANTSSPPVYATHDGVAVCINSDSSIGYGTYVRITSPTGFITLYGHLVFHSCNSINGQMVTACDQIGIMDHTGFSTGTHLHYELRGNPGLGTDLNFYLPSSISPNQTGPTITDSCH
ncbi:M23 family metallopeptidase, partial [Patescibacteria group bacterium]|nr:M23 family metallopeptidase [Patescibacteria group bacterium]